MYFSDRMSLGSQMAKDISLLRGTDAILICLKDRSIMSCIAMAVELRAWIYPLQYEPITSPLDPTSTLGAIVPSGEFCLNPSVSQGEFDYAQQEFFGVIEQAKREAMSRLNTAMSEYGPALDPHVMNGRNVVLVGDIVTRSLELEIVKQLLKPLKPLRIFGTAGNTTIDVSDRFHIETDESHIMDIIPTTFMTDDHYFDTQDAYSDTEKQQLVRNIAQYWA